MKFAKKIQRNRLFSTDCFLVNFPLKFPVKSPDFSKNLPLKILRKLTFFRWNPTKSADFSVNFDFSPAKSADCSANFDFFPAKIPQNRQIFPRICPWKSREILLFFHETSEALAIAKQIFRPRGQLQVNFSVKKKDPGQSRLSSSIMLMDNDKQASEKIRQVDKKTKDKKTKDKPKN